MPYILLFIVELPEGKSEMINYVEWESFGDNLFEELHNLELENEHEIEK